MAVDIGRPERSAMACLAIHGSHDKLVLFNLHMGRLSAPAVCRQKVQEDRQLQASLYDSKNYLDKTG